MKVRDLMTQTPVSCNPEMNLAAAGALMWENDCGVLPVLDEKGAVTGILTDRDICIALTTRDQRASRMTVGDVMTGKALLCSPDDDIHAALKEMQREKIRRLPVVSSAGVLEGVVSVDDVVLRAEKANGKKQPDVSYDDVVQTFQAICARRPGERHFVAA